MRIVLQGQRGALLLDGGEVEAAEQRHRLLAVLHEQSLQEIVQGRLQGGQFFHEAKGGQSVFLKSP